MLRKYLSKKIKIQGGGGGGHQYILGYEAYFYINDLPVL
jgi:hypothetical protein